MLDEDFIDAISNMRKVAVDAVSTTCRRWKGDIFYVFSPTTMDLVLCFLEMATKADDNDTYF